MSDTAISKGSREAAISGETTAVDAMRHDGPGLAYAPATSLVSALRRREVSARELVGLYLQRIASSTVNAVVTLDADRALTAAAAADEALVRGAPTGPLHGLPVTVKDSLETAGLRTTAGAPELADHVPARDAVAVARLRAAGAIVLGKTNLPPWAGQPETANPLFGRTTNPWDPARTPGGSSGGAAAAVAAGLTGLDVGSDLGGSIRQPAHYCGVFGHKPTHGTIPTRGHLPPLPAGRSSTDLAVVGPLARSAGDLDLALSVLAGPDDDRAIAWRLTSPPPRRPHPTGLRVGTWFDDPSCPVDRTVGALLEAAAEALSAAGAVVRPVQRPPVDLMHAAEVHHSLVQAVISGGIPDEAFAVLVGAATGEGEHARYARGVTARVRDWHRLDEERHALRASWAAFFDDHDVLLTPVTPTPALPHQEDLAPQDRGLVINGVPRPLGSQWAWVALASPTLLPATVAPVGTTPTGLPVGVQIIGPYLEDRTTIAVAGHLEGLLGGAAPPPRW